MKLKTSATFRAIGKIVIILNLKLKIDFGTPSHETISIWVKKIGYYNLKKEKTKADDWIIIIDESIELGQEKLLMIFGIRNKDLKFKQSLKFEELTPLKEISKKTWNGAIINQELKALQREIGKIKYAVGDYGGSIKKGLELSKIRHVHDITHKMALIVEKFYKKDETYQSITKNMNSLRMQLGQTKYAHLIPPKQRSKARYQNIGIIANWGVKMINYLRRENDEEINKKFGWIKKYEDFIKELKQIDDKIKIVSEIVKNKGLSEKTAKKSLKEFSKIKGSKGLIIKMIMREYFKETREMIKEESKILITSDIIESSFGKYKNYLSNNKMIGITNLALSISAFTSKLTTDEIKEALEKTTVNDIQKWTKDNIGKTLLNKRKIAFSH